MRTSHLLATTVALVALAAAWPARAGDERSVAERLQSLEERVGQIEERWTKIEQALIGQVPNLLAARLKANEAAAIATLRNIMVAQAQFQQSAKADEDNDGTGEYGGFVELSGAAAGRMLQPLTPAVLSAAFRVLNSNGEASRSGYFFRMYLCGPKGVGIGETQKGFEKGLADADFSETTFCCYAWPVEHGVSGQRTFCMTQDGDVIATDAAAYSGTGKGPRAQAAFRDDTILGRTVLGVKANDSNTWQRVN